MNTVVTFPLTSSKNSRSTVISSIATSSRSKICAAISSAPAQTLTAKINSLLCPSPRQFRAQIEAEGSDSEEKNFFEDIRDRTPVPVSFE